MDENEKIKGFWDKYAGAIIGVIIALLLIIFGLVGFLIDIAVIVGLGFGGSYVQKNKVSIKEKVKAFIDKL